MFVKLGKKVSYEFQIHKSIILICRKTILLKNAITQKSKQTAPHNLQVLLYALLGTATSKPVAEADLRFSRSADAEAKAEPDAEALRPFAYSSPAGAVSFSLGGVRIKMIVDIIMEICLSVSS